MNVNLNRPQKWKEDIAQSVDMYNTWFMKFAPTAYRDTRIKTSEDVKETLIATRNLTDVSPQLLRLHPKCLPTLRMSTCPPLAVDRLIGLAGIPARLVETMEKDGKLPVRLQGAELNAGLEKIGNIIERMADPDIFVWLERDDAPSEQELYRACTIIADRLCGSVANPIIRNAQEKRQLNAIQKWLEARNYRMLPAGKGIKFEAMPTGTFSFRLNVPVDQGSQGNKVMIPVDVVVMRHSAEPGELPLLIEAKSAGDFTNVNKRRKEEAIKITQLRQTYGADRTRFILFLCGYFDSGYLGYEAAEGIDWVWEHRIDDLASFGL